MRWRLRRRRAAEQRFRRWGLFAICAATVTLAALLASVAWKGYAAFLHTHIRLEIDLDPELLGLWEGRDGEPFQRALARADFGAVVRESLRGIFRHWALLGCFPPIDPIHPEAP